MSFIAGTEMSTCWSTCMSVSSGKNLWRIGAVFASFQLSLSSALFSCLIRRLSSIWVIGRSRGGRDRAFFASWSAKDVFEDGFVDEEEERLGRTGRATEEAGDETESGGKCVEWTEEPEEVFEVVEEFSSVQRRTLRSWFLQTLHPQTDQECLTCQRHQHE